MDVGFAALVFAASICAIIFLARSTRCKAHKKRRRFGMLGAAALGLAALVYIAASVLLLNRIN